MSTARSSDGCRTPWTASRYRVGSSTPGRIYYAETRYRVAASSPGTGAFAYSGARCPEGEFTDGDVVSCVLSLDNVGPATLRDTTVRCRREEDNGHQAVFSCSMSAENAVPRRTPSAGGPIIDFERGGEWEVEFVPGRAEFFEGERTTRLSGDLLAEGVVVPAIRVTDGRRIRFQVEPHMRGGAG